MVHLDCCPRSRSFPCPQLARPASPGVCPSFTLPCKGLLSLCVGFGRTRASRYFREGMWEGRGHLAEKGRASLWAFTCKSVEAPGERRAVGSFGLALTPAGLASRRPFALAAAHVRRRLPGRTHWVAGRASRRSAGRDAPRRPDLGASVVVDPRLLRALGPV